MALHQQFLKGTLNHYYLCHYKSKAAGSDRLSQSLLRFKSGCDVDVDAWSSCAVEELNKLALPEIHSFFAHYQVQKQLSCKIPAWIGWGQGYRKN